MSDDRFDVFRNSGKEWLRL